VRSLLRIVAALVPFIAVIPAHAEQAGNFVLHALTDGRSDAESKLLEPTLAAAFAKLQTAPAASLCSELPGLYPYLTNSQGDPNITSLNMKMVSDVKDTSATVKYSLGLTNPVTNKSATTNYTVTLKWFSNGSDSGWKIYDVCDGGDCYRQTVLNFCKSQKKQ
jgi:hypothetical protein